MSLFIFRRLFKGRKSGKDVRDVSVETADITRHDNGDDDTSEITFEVLENTSAFKSSETGSYKSSYLVSYPVGNRIQVYINRESYAYIKRFLAVTAPEMPISGFVNRIIDEHLKKYEHEMSKLYTECITKPFYFTVKAVCAVYILCHLWTFIFHRRMYGIWDRILRLMRIARVRVWRNRRQRKEEAERRARRKARRRKPETDKSKGKTETAVPSSSSDDDDVIGKTKVIYLEDPKVARMTPTRSEPMEKIPLEEDEDIGSDDVEQENKGLTEEEREELMAPVDAEPDPDFNTALTIEEINNVAEVLTSGIVDEQKALRAARTIHYKLSETEILAFLTDKLSNLEKVNGLLDKYLGNRRGVSGRKGSKEDEPFDIDKYA